MIKVLAVFVGVVASSLPINGAGGGRDTVPYLSAGEPPPRIPPRGYVVITIDGLTLISTGFRLVLWDSPDGQEVADEISAVNREETQ